MGVLLPKNLYGERLPVAIAQWGLITLGNYEVCVFPSVNDPRGLVAKGNYEVSVSQVSMPLGASSPRETMKLVFPKCRCPEGPRRQGKI